MCNISEGVYRLCECGRYDGLPHLHITGHKQQGPYTTVEDAIVALYPRYAANEITDTEILLVGRAIFQTLPLKAADHESEDQLIQIAKEKTNIKKSLRHFTGTRLREMLDKIFAETPPVISSKYDTNDLVGRVIGTMRGELTGLEELIASSPPPF